MIPVPAMRVRQFGVDFYQAVLTGTDVQKLVRFEVLSYDAGVVQPANAAKKGKKRKATINWELLEKRIARSAEAYQRPVIPGESRSPLVIPAEKMGVFQASSGIIRG